MGQSTKQECERAITTILAGFTPSEAEVVNKQPSRGEVYVTHVWTKDTWTQGFRYVCLPDTVDPRGPKGK
jgi:hypothetical protein